MKKQHKKKPYNTLDLHIARPEKLMSSVLIKLFHMPKFKVGDIGGFPKQDQNKLIPPLSTITKSSTYIYFLVLFLCPKLAISSSYTKLPSTNTSPVYMAASSL